MTTPKTRKPLQVTPIDALVADLVTQFDDDLREEFEERAAIVEFEGKIPRAHAECLALVDVLSRRPSAIVGISTRQIELNGTSYWFVTTDLEEARQHLSEVGAKEVSVGELARVLDDEYGGMAILQSVGQCGA